MCGVVQDFVWFWCPLLQWYLRCDVPRHLHRRRDCHPARQVTVCALGNHWGWGAGSGLVLLLVCGLFFSIKAGSLQPDNSCCVPWSAAHTEVRSGSHWRKMWLPWMDYLLGILSCDGSVEMLCQFMDLVRLSSNPGIAADLLDTSRCPLSRDWEECEISKMWHFTLQTVQKFINLIGV